MGSTQLRTTLALAGLVVASALAAGGFAQRAAQQRSTAELADRLRTALERAAVEIGTRPLRSADREALWRLAADVAERTGVRITLIAPDGSVVGDSAFPLSRSGGVENHLRRREVSAALEGRASELVRRHSATIGRSLAYLAVPATAGGAIRAARSAEPIEAAASSARAAVAFGMAIGLILAVAVARRLAREIAAPLARFRGTVDQLGAGELSARTRWHSPDDFGATADAIDEMAERLEARFAETRAANDQHGAVLREMVEAVLVVDEHGKITLANPALLALFGVSGELEGRVLHEAIRSAALQDLVEAARVAKGTIERGLVIDAPQRRVFWAHGSRVELRSGPGSAIVLHDVTEVERLETIRRDFVANASHELKTPLTAIRGFAETLVDADLSPRDAKSYLGVILSNAERMTQLVDDLLELTRIETGAERLASESLFLAPIIESALRSSEPGAKTRGVTVEFLRREAAAVRADPMAVAQVVQNLLDNAIQYTEAGGHVEVSLEAGEKSVVTRVTDTGIGIREADRQRIFERFYRVDPARSRALGGTGLGLAIVKHLVQQMGGHVSVESTPGEGSTFAFTLPRA